MADEFDFNPDFSDDEVTETAPTVYKAATVVTNDSNQSVTINNLVEMTKQHIADDARVRGEIDELTGIIHAYSLMRPEGMEGMEVKSLKKKFKDKKFAAKCNREIIKNGVADLGMDLGDVMACCIKGMTEHKAELV